MSAQQASRVASGRRLRSESVAGQDDVSLVARIAGGDSEAFESLARRYMPRLTRFLDRLTHQPQLIEEIVDDTLLVVWRKAGTYDSQAKVSTWIFAIGARRARKALKRADPPVAYEPDRTIDANAVNPSEETERRDARAALRRAVLLLSPDHRNVIELTYFGGYSCREVAEIVGCPVETVKTRMFYARRRLKALLSDQTGTRP
jgi:RNA polymerase sigma-70 factor (ECF subfamily)